MFSEGDQIGSYSIRRRLGAGGMGEVYLADHRHIDRRAAIKVLLPALSTDPDIVARFFTEARAASRIKHAGIVEILDCEVHPSGRAYIVMEFLDGESLGDAMARVGVFELKSTLGIAGQIASALGAAHAKGIVHRDLKPDNVFLASTPGAESPIAVKVLDFGIAKLAGEGTGSARRTATGSLLGTPLYMSPEQCRGTGKIDHRTDIYSLGCILYEMVAARPPFLREGAGELIAAHLGEIPPDVASVADAVPVELGTLIMRMLAKDPGERPQTMPDVVQSIERLAKVGSSRFQTLILPPAGYPASDGISDPEPREPSLPRPVTYQSNPGGTRVIPEKSTTFNQTASEIQRPTREQIPRSRLPVIVALSTVAVGLGAVAFILLRPTPNEGQKPALSVERPPQEFRESPPVEAVPAPPPEKDPPPVRIEVDSRPSGAEVWLPGEVAARGKAPLAIAVPRGAKNVTVTLKLSGYRDKAIVLDSAGSDAVNVAMEKVPSSKPARPPSPRPSAPKTPSAPTSYPMLRDQ